MAKKTETRGVRDEMNVGPDPGKTRHLVPLKQLKKFEMADGDPDVRGWNVFTSTGRDIGEVEDLLVDVDTGNVVMIDVDLRGQNRHTLAPIRATWIDRATKRVVVDAGEVGDEGADLPTFTRGAAATDEEVNSFDERYSRAYARHVDDNEYRMRHGKEELRFGRPAENSAEPAPAVEDRLDRLEADQNAARRTRIVERQALASDARYQVNEQDQRRVRYQSPEQEEVIERRPYVEEVVVRRRPVDEA
jgi:sporulation protein YlmC with PRC-barrel domain